MTTDTTKPDFADSLEAQMLADYVSNGETMIDACATLGLAVRTTYTRIRESERFREMMEEARKIGFHVIANRIRKVVRGELGHSTGDVKRDRLIADSDFKLLAKWHPQEYGEKIQVEQKTATIAIPVSDDPIAAQRAYEELMKGG